VQGAWALVLSMFTAEQDVLFGATVSGRSAGLDGIESMVGLFINTVPVRARISGNEPLVQWLARLQEQQAETRQFEHCPLARIQEWSEIPSGVPLFDNHVVFENFPMEEF